VSVFNFDKGHFLNAQKLCNEEGSLSLSLQKRAAYPELDAQRYSLSLGNSHLDPDWDMDQRL
jgi:hypothetical protein